MTRLYRQTRELDALKTQFFSNVSHELRTPLALIAGPVAQLLESGPTPEQQRLLDLLDRNARLLRRHVDDLLDVSRLEAGRMQVRYTRTDLADLVRVTASCFSPLTDEKALRFDVRTPERLEAEVDADKYQRVVVNLLSNAFKFTPAGGAVTLTLQPDGPDALLTVSDNGPGIAPEHRSLIFEPFRQVQGDATREHGGTGLGLSIVRQFAELHGGAVDVDGALGRGSVFTVRVPTRAPAGTGVAGDGLVIGTRSAVQAADELRERAADAVGATAAVQVDAPLVLVVEDNPDMNAFILQVLRPHYRLASASDGREGLAKALALSPDLILSDVMMPRMSGDEMVAAIRQHAELIDVPVVMLTAKADQAVQTGLLTAGAQDYIAKPFVTAELLARLSNLLAGRRRVTSALAAQNVLRTVVNETPDPIFTKDRQGRYRLFNAAAARLTGKAPDSVLGRDDAFLFPPAEAAAVTATDRLVMESRQIRTDEVRLTGGDGQVHVMLTTKGPLVDAASDVVGLWGVGRDVTERDEAERALHETTRQLEQHVAQLELANAELDDFAYITSHDLKEPLRGIHNYAAFLLEDYADRLDDPGKAKLETLMRLARRLEDLTSDLLHYSRLGRTDVVKAPVDIGAVVNGVAEDLRAFFAEHHVQLEVAPDLPTVPGDAVLIREVFRNLLTNAGKYNDRDARFVGVEWRGSDSGPIMFIVRDDGIGIRPEHQERIFKIFKRLHARDKYGGGTGSGLTLARKIIERHGGRIWVESEPGVGSRFMFTLTGSDTDA